MSGTIVAKIRCGAMGCTNGFTGPIISDGWYAQLPFPPKGFEEHRNTHNGPEWLIQLGETDNRNLVRCPKHCKMQGGKDLHHGGKWVWDD